MLEAYHVVAVIRHRRHTSSTFTLVACVERTLTDKRRFLLELSYQHRIVDDSLHVYIGTLFHHWFSN